MPLPAVRVMSLLAHNTAGRRPFASCAYAETTWAVPPPPRRCDAHNSAAPPALAGRDQQHERPLPLARLRGETQRVVSVLHRLRHLDRHRRRAGPVVAELPRHRCHGNPCLVGLSTDHIVARPVDHPLHVDGHIGVRARVHRNDGRRHVHRHRKTARAERRRRRRRSGPPRLVRLRRQRERQLSATRKNRFRKIRLVGRPAIDVQPVDVLQPVVSGRTRRGDPNEFVCGKGNFDAIEQRCVHGQGRRPRDAGIQAHRRPHIPSRHGAQVVIARLAVGRRAE